MYKVVEAYAEDVPQILNGWEPLDPEVKWEGEGIRWTLIKGYFVVWVEENFTNFLGIARDLQTAMRKCTEAVLSY